jgi:hypothetical protein
MNASFIGSYQLISTLRPTGFAFSTSPAPPGDSSAFQLVSSSQEPLLPGHNSLQRRHRRLPHSSEKAEMLKAAW